MCNELNYVNQKISIAIATVCLSTLLVAGPVSAQSVDPEWPYVQALIPEVALAVMWPNVIEESKLGKWRDNDQVAQLAEALGDIPAFTDKEEKLIAEFVKLQPQEQLTDSLDQLAEGVMSVANRLRSRYISGIKRYTRQQIAIASQVEQSLNKLAELGDDQSPERTELEESLTWHERVYDQREQAITSLCERPVELEEKLSSVMRNLSMHLP